MKNNAILAQKYAKAFLNLYADDIQVEDYLKILDACAYLQMHGDVLILLDVYDIKDNLENLLDKLLEKIGLIKQFKQLIILLMSKRRLSLFRDVLKFICIEYQDYKNMLYFDIYSAKNLDSHDQVIIKEFLSKLSGSGIMYRCHVDESLIAGVRALNSYYSWEDSIRGRLQKIKSIVDLGV